jgi:hypothetical protein
LDTVKAQLHIKPDSPAWDVCSDWVGKNYTKYREGSIEIYKELKGQYDILKYSGDADSVVASYGTQ